MPDQPADPIHYDMKIPPEKHPAQPEDAADSSNSSDDSPSSDTSKETDTSGAEKENHPPRSQK